MNFMKRSQKEYLPTEEQKTHEIESIKNLICSPISLPTISSIKERQKSLNNNKKYILINNSTKISYRDLKNHNKKNLTIKPTNHNQTYNQENISIIHTPYHGLEKQRILNEEPKDNFSIPLWTNTIFKNNTSLYSQIRNPEKNKKIFNKIKSLKQQYQFPSQQQYQYNSPSNLSNQNIYLNYQKNKKSFKTKKVIKKDNSCNTYNNNYNSNFYEQFCNFKNRTKKNFNTENMNNTRRSTNDKNYYSEKANRIISLQESNKKKAINVGEIFNKNFMKDRAKKELNEIKQTAEQRVQINSAYALDMNMINKLKSTTHDNKFKIDKNIIKIKKDKESLSPHKKPVSNMEIKLKKNVDFWKDKEKNNDEDKMGKSWGEKKNCYKKFQFDKNKTSINEATSLLNRLDDQIKETFDEFRLTTENEFKDIMREVRYNLKNDEKKDKIEKANK